MSYENQILDALMIVSAWNVPDEDLATTLYDQARLMAGDDHDVFLEPLIDIIN